ncbi:MAG TPA: GNAT family N-acetyltransferase [Microvirga sp.]|nr:GNAT family N-acetyltransferase [Microvirga sp.]
MTLSLLEPGPALLAGYAAALDAGWSPNTTRDVSREQLAALRADPDAFLRDLTDPDGTVTLADGTVMPRLPFALFWLSDGEFCGSINFRFQRGTESLPPTCSGHIGYSIVPWKRRRGYATEALRLVLPVARREGFARVSVTCDADNLGSIRVIEANRGILTDRAPHPERPGQDKLTYWIALDG